MYPKTGEWLELGILFIGGPLHVVACVVLAVIAWWRAPGWNMTARVTVLAATVLLGSVPVATALNVGPENAWFHSYGLGLAACELLAMGGLAAALIFRRAAASSQR